MMYNCIMYSKRHGKLLFDFREDELWWLTPKDRQQLIPSWWSEKTERT